MLEDCHLHTRFSLDSETPVENMIQQAIHLGMKGMCFTDHMDMDFPEPLDFTFPPQEYFQKLETYKNKYKNQIQIRVGVELGLQTSLVKKHEEFLGKYPFDFVIGSLHLVNNMDPYYEHTFQGKTDGQVYGDYFSSLLENVKVHDNFDSLGHLDYVVRYGKHKAKEYSYGKFAMLIDEILKVLIAKEKALEVNTAGLKKGLGFPNPHFDVLKRYYELGGRLLTLGSDAHTPDQIAYGFELVGTMLKDVGFKEIAIYRKRNPHFIKL